jgi:hypothetical protein
VGLRSDELDALSPAMDEDQSAPVAGDNNSNHGENVNNGDDSIAITGKEYTPLQFWNYIDDYLEYVHSVPYKDIRDSAARKHKIDWYGFTISIHFIGDCLIVSSGSSRWHCKLTCAITGVVPSYPLHHQTTHFQCGRRRYNAVLAGC